MSLHSEMVADMLEIETDMGTPTFTWKGNPYNCIASLSQFKRELETGGFQFVKMLTLTVPRYDTTGTATFPSDILPQSQQLLTFESGNYRIESIQSDSIYDYDSGGILSNGARIRIIAVQTTKGI